MTLEETLHGLDKFFGILDIKMKEIEKVESELKEELKIEINNEAIEELNNGIDEETQEKINNEINKETEDKINDDIFENKEPKIDDDKINVENVEEPKTKRIKLDTTPKLIKKKMKIPNSNKNFLSDPDLDISKLSNDQMNRIVEKCDETVSTLNGMLITINARVSVMDDAFNRLHRVLSKNFVQKAILKFNTQRRKKFFCICKSKMNDLGAGVVACDSGFCDTVWFHKACVSFNEDNDELFICKNCQIKMRNQSN